MKEIGQRTFIDHVTFEGGFSPGFATTESLTFSVNPDTGNDPPVTAVLNTQALVDAYGTFASARGVFAVLPTQIKHPIDIVYDAGSFDISYNEFEGFGRLVFEEWLPYTTPAYDWWNDGGDWETLRKGSVYIRGASGMTKVAGSPTMDISTTTGGYSITLDSDPGLPADGYQGKWLKIVAGIGVGQYKAIRRHSGNNFEVAGRFSPVDNTSQVEVFEEATTLSYDYTDLSYLQFRGNNGRVSTLMKPLGISDIILNCTGASTAVQFIGCDVFFKRVSINGSLYVISSSCELNDLIILGGGTGWGLAVWSNVLRGGTSASSWLIRNFSTGILGSGADTGLFLYLYKGSIDDCSGDAVYVAGKFNADFYSNLSTYGILGYGIATAANYSGPSMRVDISYSLAGLSPTGALGDMLIDGIVASYTDIGTAGDNLEGPAGTRIIAY